MSSTNVTLHGPFLVLECYRSYFKLQLRTRQEVVNISRLHAFGHFACSASETRPPQEASPSSTNCCLARTRSSSFSHQVQWNRLPLFSSTSTIRTSGTTYQIRQSFRHAPFGLRLEGRPVDDDIRH